MSDITEPDLDEPPVPVIDVSATEVVATSSEQSTDPTFRIGSLPAANKPLVTTGQDDLLSIE
jgi:hypothetical protein